MNYARKLGHDYHEGYYFVTIATAPRRCCLSRIVEGRVDLLALGELVLKAILQMAADSPEIDLRVCAIMPDHFHAVVVFRRHSEHPLGWHIRRFKAWATKWARDLSGDPTLGLFEENFHDFKFRYGEAMSRVTMDLDTAWRTDLDGFFRGLREKLAAGWNGFSGEVRVLRQASPRGIPRDAA